MELFTRETSAGTLTATATDTEVVITLAGQPIIGVISPLPAAIARKVPAPFTHWLAGRIVLTRAEADAIARAKAQFTHPYTLTAAERADAEQAAQQRAWDRGDEAGAFRKGAR